MLATLGLSIILANSAIAFNIVKYLGAFYLVYLGTKSLTSGNVPQSKPGKEDLTTEYLKLYLSGVLTSVLNPKVALFFLAFLPRFVIPNYEQNWIPFLILGMIFFVLGTSWCLIVAIFASRLSLQSRRNPSFKIWLDRISGSIFIILGLKIALSRK